MHGSFACVSCASHYVHARGYTPSNPLALRHNAQLHFGEGTDGPVRVWVFDPQTHIDLRFDEDGDIGLVQQLGRDAALDGRVRSPDAQV